MICFLLDPTSSDRLIAQLAQAMAVGTVQLRRSYEAFLQDVAAGQVALLGKAPRLNHNEPKPLQAALRRSLLLACAAR